MFKLEYIKRFRELLYSVGLYQSLEFLTDCISSFKQTNLERVVDKRASSYRCYHLYCI